MVSNPTTYRNAADIKGSNVLCSPYRRSLSSEQSRDKYKRHHKFCCITEEARNHWVYVLPVSKIKKTIFRSDAEITLELHGDFKYIQAPSFLVKLHLRSTVLLSGFQSSPRALKSTEQGSLADVVNGASFHKSRAWQIVLFDTLLHICYSFQMVKDWEVPKLLVFRSIFLYCIKCYTFIR